MSRHVVCTVVLLMPVILPVVALGIGFPDLVLQSDPIHLGDTSNAEWSYCTPPVPPTPIGECDVVGFVLDVPQAHVLRYLTIRSSGASSPSSGKVYFDDIFLGYIPGAAGGARCDFSVDYVYVPRSIRTPGYHEVRICTSIYDYRHGSELDDMAFYDLRFVHKKARSAKNTGTSSLSMVPTEEISWGVIKQLYSE